MADTGYLKNLSEFQVDRPAAQRSFKKYGIDITGMNDTQILDLSKKFDEIRKMAPNEESVGGRFLKSLEESNSKYNKINPILENNFAQEMEKNMVRANVGKAASVLGKVAGPAVGIAQAGLGLQDILDKTKAGASLKEAATDPEVVKGLARGVYGYAGGDVGGALGSMVPGGMGTKAIGALAGSVAGAYGGVKLADMMTGNPTIDKIITDQHEKAKNERIQSEEYLKNPRMADAAPKNMELRPATTTESSPAGVSISPEVIKQLEAKRDALSQRRRDLEDQRRRDEYDAMVRARQARARDSALKATEQ